MVHFDVCSYHVTYTFYSNSKLCSCLKVKEPLARIKHDTWNLSDCNRIRTTTERLQGTTKRTFTLKRTCDKNIQSIATYRHILKTQPYHWTWLEMPDHTQPEVGPPEFFFIGDYLQEKNLRYWLIPSRDIYDHRIGQSDWMKAYFSVKLETSCIRLGKNNCFFFFPKIN